MTDSPGSSSPTLERVRKAQPHDLEALTTLEVRAFDTPWSQRALASSLETPESRAWLIDDPATGKSTAYALFRVVVEEAELLRVAVDPAYRRRGLGRQLLTTTLDLLATNGGVKLCHLEVRADNPGAQALYHVLGFEQVGRRPAYYADGVDALLLHRLLSTP